LRRGRGRERESFRGASREAHRRCESSSDEPPRSGGRSALARGEHKGTREPKRQMETNVGAWAGEPYQGQRRFIQRIDSPRKAEAALFSRRGSVERQLTARRVHIGPT